MARRPLFIFNSKKSPLAFFLFLGGVALLEGLSFAGFISTDPILERLPVKADPVYRDDRELGWRFRPYAPVEASGGKERVNALGWRGPEINLHEKKPRIACLGDSTTFGVHFAADAETYPRLLERLLKEQRGCPECEVLNLGVNGYGTFHGAALAKGELSALGVRVALIYFGWNDSARLMGWFNHPEKILFLNSRWGRSYLCRWFFRVSDLWIEDLRRSRKLRRLFPAAGVKHGDTPEGVARNLENFIARARQNQIIPVLATTPWGWKDSLADRFIAATEKERQDMLLSDSHIAHNLQEYNGRVRTLAAQKGAVLVDLEAIFKTLPESERAVYFFADFMHPTPKGDALIAETLAAALLPLLRTADEGLKEPQRGTYA